MKTIFKNLGLGLLMTGSLVFVGTNAYAQDAATAPAADVCKETEQQQALYKQYTDNTVKGATIEQTEIAIKAGEEYVQKYGACADQKQLVDYFNKYIPGMKTRVAKAKKGAAQDAIITRFDNAAKAKNTAEVFASGKEILAKEADFADVSLDVAITLASAGFEQAKAKPPVDTYNNDTIAAAKNAISKLESGKTADAWGVYTYSLKQGKDSKFKDQKAYTLGTLNYFVGNIMYLNQGTNDAAKKKEALPYLYKATQYDSFAKAEPFVYQAIGAWYIDEALRIEKERQAILAAMPEKERKDNEQTLAMVGEQKGYADRAIDAYGRAYKLAKANPKADKAYVDNLYTRLKEYYGFRFDGKVENMDASIAKADTTPLPDPGTPITPVKIETTEPTTAPTTGTTTPTTGATTAKPAADTTKPATGTTTTKPATTATPKPATAPTTGATKPAGTAATDAKVTDSKAAVKKPAPKKKGSR